MRRRLLAPSRQMSAALKMSAALEEIFSFTKHPELLSRHFYPSKKSLNDVRNSARSLLLQTWRDTAASGSDPTTRQQKARHKSNAARRFRRALALGFGQRSFLPRAHLPWTLGRKKRASGSGRAAGIQTSAHSMTMDNDDSLMLDEKSAPPGGTQNGAGVNGTANGANETVWCVECEDVAASLKCVPRQPWGAKTPCAGP